VLGTPLDLLIILGYELPLNKKGQALKPALFN
jgi:hypothetical protein